MSFFVIQFLFSFLFVYVFYSLFRKYLWSVPILSLIFFGLLLVFQIYTYGTGSFTERYHHFFSNDTAVILWFIIPILISNTILTIIFYVYIWIKKKKGN